MGLGSTCSNVMSCHGYGPIDTGLWGLLNPNKGIAHDEHDPTFKPNKLNNNLETSPSDSSSSPGENGEIGTDGEVSTTSSNLGPKIQKSVSFGNSNKNSVVAGLWVKILEKDTDGTIRRVKVTHSESE